MTEATIKFECVCVSAYVYIMLSIFIIICIFPNITYWILYRFMITMIKIYQVTIYIIRTHISLCIYVPVLTCKSMLTTVYTKYMQKRHDISFPIIYMNTDFMRRQN